MYSDAISLTIPNGENITYSHYLHQLEDERIRVATTVATPKRDAIARMHIDKERLARGLSIPEPRNTVKRRPRELVRGTT